jgi:predicted kinase
VRELRIKRVHADLRSDAVCFVDGICVFDCVEFNRRLNLMDVARDTGFLEMDLRFRGHPELARLFVERYLEADRDPEHREVLGFYAMHSACVRGKVEALLLDLPEIREKEKRRASRAAARYFELAVEYARELPPAMLVITCGLPGSGKSSLARALAPAGFEILSSDVVRKKLSGVSPAEHRYEALDRGIYTTDATERTYRALLDEATPFLEAGRSVILDASFTRRANRRLAARLAAATGAQFACVHLEIDDPTARSRIERRVAEGGDVSDARWHVYQGQKRRFQRPTEVPPDRLISVNATTALPAQTKQVLRHLQKISPLSVAVV